jgi:hypothetical protein
MPRFFFHVQTIDGVTDKDDIGTDFSSEADAVLEAQALAKELMTDATLAGHTVEHHIHVTDADGKPVVCLDCTTAIETKLPDK